MIEDFFPKAGPLHQMCLAVQNTKKVRWNKFLRECKKIPRTSPVYGSTSFKAINERRHQLIRSDIETESEEEKVLSRCVSIGAGAYTAVNLLVAKRMIRHMKRQMKQMGIDECTTVDASSPSRYGGRILTNERQVPRS